MNSFIFLFLTSFISSVMSQHHKMMQYCITTKYWDFPLSAAIKTCEFLHPLRITSDLKNLCTHRSATTRTTSLSDKLIHVWTAKKKKAFKPVRGIMWVLRLSWCVYACGIQETACTPTPCFKYLFWSKMGVKWETVFSRCISEDFWTPAVSCLRA